MIQLTENTEDVDILVITAFHILAGKPLANFASEFTKWSFGCSLNSSYSSPHKDFISLIRYNLVDWENTRTQLLNEAKILNSSDNSSVAKWAYIRILYATGESSDAKFAENLAKQLRNDAYSGGWRRIENYCSTDPCDPESLEPENIVKAIQVCHELDVCKIWNDLNQTSESLLLHDIQTGLARFRPNEVVSKYRELITDILCRTQYPLQCGILNIDQHNLLFTKDHVARLLDVHKLDKDSEIFDGLTENNKNFVNQYSIMQILPYIEPIQQVEILMNFKEEDNVFTDLIEIMEPITHQELNQVFDRKLQEDQLLNLLYYASTNEIDLTEKYKQILKENLNSHNSFIRTEVFRTISIHEDMDLLNDFIKINWSGLTTDANDHELFYGSLLWLLSAKNNLVDEETAVANINPNIYGNANEYLSIIGLQKIAFAIDSIFKVIINTNIDFPDLEIIENLSLKRNVTSLFSVDRREENVNFEQDLKSLSESEEAFEKRYENQNQQFDNYISYLKTKGADLILNGMLPEAFAHIANSAPELKDEWFNTFSKLSSSHIPKFYNFILLLAYTYSEDDTQKAQFLWDKISNSDSYTNITIGQEKIPLKQMSIWGSSNRDLDAYRFDVC